MEGDAPDVYARDSRRQEFAHWDAPFVAWLEARGYDVGYCTDFDLHVRRRRCSAADGLLLSRRARRVLERADAAQVLEFVDRGGSVCFFAGDVACFKVEFSASGDRLFCPKMAGELAGGRRPGSDRRAVARPRSAGLADDVSGACGGGWWDGRRAIDAYQPVVPRSLDLRRGRRPARGGISGGADTPVIGYETDGVRLDAGV